MNLLEVGLCFDGPEQFKKALSKYAAMTHRNIYCRHNDSKRIRVKCEDCCPFSLSASYDGKSGNLMVKSHIPKHRCNLKFDLKMVTTKYLANAIRDNIIKMPMMKLKDLHAHIEVNMRLDVKRTLVKKAKIIVISELDKQIKEEYNRLWDYSKELKRTNPGSKIEMMLEPTVPDSPSILKRFYVCFKACK